MGRYYDKSGKPLNLFEWADLFEDKAYSRVALDKVAPEVCVSTVWLGLDHRFLEDGPPIIFETAVYNGKHYEVTDRYTTEAEAEAGHLETVHKLQSAVNS